MDISGVLSAIVAGLLIGWLGRLLAPGKHKRLGLLLTMGIGIVGALIGEAVAEWVDIDGWALTLVVQAVAAALLVTMFAPRRRRG